ncbi:hypothetical protein ABEV74_22410, partial [Paenibacillus cisolokensis]|uniref:hypothetical protein n=1 Tax=Paenibacillus cisolokensis TaxID=1658519 RepID=UPI003D2759D1
RYLAKNRSSGIVMNLSNAICLKLVKFKRNIVNKSNVSVSANEPGLIPSLDAEAIELFMPWSNLIPVEYRMKKNKQQRRKKGRR